jgi:hypothetical protein
VTKDRKRTTDNGETKKKTLSKKQRRRQRGIHRIRKIETGGDKK